MSIRKQYIKPKTEILHVDQEFPLMAVSSEGPGIDKDPHQEVVDPGGQLAKPAGPFRSFMEDFDSAGWED